jgi:hypothetical protein
MSNDGKYPGYVSVTKALGDGEMPTVRRPSGDEGYVFVQFGDDSSSGTGGVAVHGYLGDMAEALSFALTEMQNLIDAAED